MTGRQGHNHAQHPGERGFQPVRAGRDRIPTPAPATNTAPAPTASAPTAGAETAGESRLAGGAGAGPMFSFGADTGPRIMPAGTILYHATANRAQAESILADGFDDARLGTGCGQDEGTGHYFCEDPDEAAEWGLFVVKVQTSRELRLAGCDNWDRDTGTAEETDGHIGDVGDVIVYRGADVRGMSVLAPVGTLFAGETLYVGVPAGEAERILSGGLSGPVRLCDHYDASDGEAVFAVCPVRDLNLGEPGYEPGVRREGKDGHQAGAHEFLVYEPTAVEVVRRVR